MRACIFVLVGFAHRARADADSTNTDAVISGNRPRKEKSLRALSSLLYYSTLPSQRPHYHSGYADYGPRYRGSAAYTNRQGRGYNGDNGYYSDQYYGRSYGRGDYDDRGRGYEMRGYGRGGHRMARYARPYGTGYDRRYSGGDYRMGGNSRHGMDYHWADGGYEIN